MDKLRTTRWLAVAIMGCATTGAAAADDLGGFYFGANFGRARNAYDTKFIDSQYQGVATAAGDSLEQTARSLQKMSDIWWADAGYFFTPYTALDLAFVHAGEVRYQTAGTLSVQGVTKATQLSSELTSRGPAAALLVRLPLSEYFEFDVRLGDYVGKSQLRETIAVAGHSVALGASSTRSSLFGGVGLAYTFAGHWSLRADFLRINQAGDSQSTGRYSVNMASAGLGFAF